MRSTARAAAVLALAAALAACGGDGTEAGGASDGAPAVSTPAAPMDTTPAGTPAPPATAGAAATIDSAASRTVTVRLTEFYIEMSRDTVPAGDVIFQVSNVGRIEHAIEVEGRDVDVETERLAPGAASNLAITLLPGTYEVYCPVDENNVDHEGRGMRRTLVVI